jgi:hypothetical protein
LILAIFEMTKDFPKECKYTLGLDMKRDVFCWRRLKFDHLEGVVPIEN